MRRRIGRRDDDRRRRVAGHAVGRRDGGDRDRSGALGIDDVDADLDVGTAGRVRDVVDERVVEHLAVRQVNGPAVVGLDDDGAAVHRRDHAGEAERLDLVAELDRAAGLQHDARGEVRGDAAQGEAGDEGDEDRRRQQRLHLGAEEGEGDADAQHPDDVLADPRRDLTKVLADSLHRSEHPQQGPADETPGDPGDEQ